jgi:hypothetical protein
MAALILPQNQLPVNNPDPASTLEELKALLLACQTLSELKNLKQRHGEPVDAAYRALLPEQQQAVDRVAATAVPYAVYKYQGETIEREGQKLVAGALVYIDPNAAVRQSHQYVPVWLLRGLEFGWQQAVSVSRHCLTLVEKAVSAATEVPQPETGNLLDGLT